MSTTATAPIARSRYESKRMYALRVLQHLVTNGIPDLVTADEAHRIAEPFGVHAGRKGDHSSPMNRSTLAARIATYQR